MLGSATEDPDRVDPAEALMREVGAQLRRVRLERDEDLDEVAEYLRIKSAYLFGIEQGDLSAMPGRTYALGFLRTYADYLGFDGEDLIAQIKSTVENLTDRTRFRVRSPLPESRLPKAPIVALSLALVAGVYTGWSYLTRSSQVEIETVSKVPEDLRDLALEALPPEDPAEPTPALEVAPDEAPMASEPQPAATAPAEAAPEPAPDGLDPLPGNADAAMAEVAALDDPAPGVPAAGEATASMAAEAEDVPQGTSGAVPPRFEPGAGPEESGAAEVAAPSSIAPEAAAGPLGPAGLAAAPAGPAALAAAEPAVEAEPVAEDPPGPQDEPLALAAGDLDVAVAGVGPVTAEPPSLAADGGALDTDAVATPAGEVLARSPSPSASGAVAPQVYEAVNQDARVILRARDVTWIQVTSTSGNYLRTLTLGPEEAFLVPNRTDLVLWTGNAGGLEVIVDGTAVAPLGTDGQVVREVSLDPERLRASPPTGPADEVR